MREITVNLYRFDELTPEAQENAVTAWDPSPYIDSISSDFRATLEAFEDAFDVKVYRWKVDDWSYNFGFITAGRAGDAPEGDALRLARFMWNNYADAVMKGKTYFSRMHWNGEKYVYKKRTSRAAFRTGDCPLTGFYADDDIIKPIIDCLHYRRFFTEYRDIIDACLDAFFQTWRNEIDYTVSADFFADVAENNEFYFTADGKLWEGGADHA